MNEKKRNTTLNLCRKWTKGINIFDSIKKIKLKENKKVKNWQRKIKKIKSCKDVIEELQRSVGRHDFMGFNDPTTWVHSSLT